jgi:tetratricopeptide (TPR) repeat protein
VQLTDVVTDLEQDRDACLQALQSGREFLEGIDIVDPAFIEWLREERVRVDLQLGMIRPGPALMPMPFLIQLGGLPSGHGNLVGKALADAVGRLVSEFANVSLFGAGSAAIPLDLPRGGLSLHVEGTTSQDHVHLLVSLNVTDSRQTIWSQRAAVPIAEADIFARGELPPLVFQAADAALAHFPRASDWETGPRRANSLIAGALTEMFSYDSERLREADRMLIEAQDFAEPGRIYAWRCLVRQIMFVERTETDFARLVDEADEFSRKALEMSKANPLVLALVSQARVMVDENPEVGTVLARDAVALSPCNAFAHWARAGALIRIGDNEGALQAARQGTRIAARTAHVHWWEAMSGLAALRGGNHVSAISHYEAAHSRAPSFRAAMRHLLFLYLAVGERDKASRVYRALLRVEPDFTLDRIVNEPDYPAVTLRRSGLLDLYGPELARL